MNEIVILVDPHDRQIGVEEKMKAHREGKLHRAFSVFVFNEKGEMLLQKRAPQKYHSGGLWTNACCSHPRPGEAIEQAAARRLQEEMGFVCELKKAFHFIYKAELDGGLIEHEFDHVFVGNYDGKVCPNIDEVADYRWLNVQTIKHELEHFQERYTVWFKIAFEQTEFRKALRAPLSPTDHDEVIPQEYAINE
jgi:isopentenyl-diphosphate delta-isomerase